MVLTLSLTVREIKKIVKCKHWNESTAFLRYCSQALYKIFVSFFGVLEWNYTIQSVTILMKTTEQYFPMEVLTKIFESFQTSVSKQG